MCGTGKKDSCYVSGELFLGKSKKTGTGFHCANGNNLFFMLRGQKKWTFVHPDYTWLMYPILNTPMKYILSEMIPEVSCLPEVMDKIYPLWKYCPKSTVVLEPGDILLSPSWYWHTVENISDITVAVATRWLPMNKAANRFLALLQVFSKPTWEVVFELLDTDRSSSKNRAKLGDETSTLAVETIDDKIAFGKAGKAKKMWEEQKRKAKQVLSPKAYQQYCLNLEPQRID